MRAGCGAFGVALVVALAGCGSADHARLVVPPVTLAGSPAQVRVDGLRNGQRVELRVAWRSADRSTWTGRRTVRADGTGKATVGMDVLAGLKPPRGGSPFFEPSLDRNRIELVLRNGDDVLDRATFARDVQPPSVRRRELTVARDGLAGTYFAPTKPRRAAVLLFGGSEGGSTGPLPAAAQLAAHGHPALVIAYFGAPGLPRKLRRIPVETIERGMAWLRRRPAARGLSTALLGYSRGAELALLSASLHPSLARTVIALVPGAFVFPAPDGKTPAWTYHGRVVPVGFEIAVEHITGQVLVAGAGEDAIWNSANDAAAVAHSIRTDGHARLELDVFPRAGHGIALPVPFLPDGTAEAFGGDAQANQAAREQLWPRILRLLDHP